MLKQYLVVVKAQSTPLLVTTKVSRKWNNTSLHDGALVSIYFELYWVCHLDWAVTAECYFCTKNDRVEAIYTVTNLGPEEESGKSSILSSVQIDNEDPKFNLIRQKQ